MSKTKKSTTRIGNKVKRGRIMLDVLPDRLRELRLSMRNERGVELSRAALGRKIFDICDVGTGQSVKLWETGQQCPSAVVIDAYCEIFHCTPDFIFGRSETPNLTYEDNVALYQQAGEMLKHGHKVRHRKRLAAFMEDMELVKLHEYKDKIILETRKDEGHRPLGLVGYSVKETELSEKEVELLIGQIDAAIVSACYSFAELKALKNA